VFMDIQGGGKCCFCERKFESGVLGRYELDIEHFRPKGEIKAWKVPQSLLDEGIPFTAPPAASHGYYLLAYHLLNLTVACKPCNSGLKKSYFPIGGTYDLHGDDPRQMGGEQPWLMYPIGDLDVDPEDVINFYGILPRSTSQRGLVTIIFFGLDNAIGRKQLMRDRARLIVCLYPQLQMAQHSSVEAAAYVAKTCAESEPHTNCARSFVRLFQCDQAAAGRVANEANKYFVSGSL
jgi:hypothetical protein